MFTLKIKWFRTEPGEGIVDESTMFLPADEVQVGSEIKNKSELHAWEEGSHFDYAILANDGDDELIGGTRMVQIIRDGKSAWYLTSLAWLLGPDGKTIEKLTT